MADPILAMLFAVEVDLGTLAAVLAEDVPDGHRYSVTAGQLYRRIHAARCLLEKADGAQPVAAPSAGGAS